MVTAGGPMPGGARRRRTRQPRQVSPRDDEEERKMPRDEAEKRLEELGSSRRRWSSTRCSSTTGARTDGIKFPHSCGARVGRNHQRGVDGQQGEGQPEDRSEEVRDGTEGSGRRVTSVNRVARASSLCAARARLAGELARSGRAGERSASSCKDPSGAVIPGGRRAANRCWTRPERRDAGGVVMSDGQGVAVAAGLGPGTLRL